MLVRSVLTYRTNCRLRLPLNVDRASTGKALGAEMNGLINIWHNLTPGQGTLLGGAFVLFAGIIAFGTGAHESVDRGTCASTTRS